MRDLLLIKLGGSLLTDKRRPGRARPAVIARLAREIAASRGQRAILLGHGSGSFGHVAAARHGVGSGSGGAARDPHATPSPAAVAAVQRAAMTLHARVIAALDDAGAAPFSLPPSAFMVVRGARPSVRTLEPVERAIALGLLPVVCGDVLMDDRGSATVCATETVLASLAARLSRRGLVARRALWLGETAGIYDHQGATLARVDRHNLAQVRAAVGGAAGIDVTGGMLLRLETACALARRGIESWIFDGTVPGLLAAAMRGERVAGTCFAAEQAGL